MKFKSQVMTAVSGSVGGITGARNQGGLYFRARSTPVNPQSSFQTAVRNAVNQLVNAWQIDLTQTQRDGWAVYAANVPLTDVFGDTRTRTAQQHYVRSNVNRLQAGLARVDDPPTTFNLGDFTTPTIEGFHPDGVQITLGFNESDNWVGTDGAALLVYASRPQSQTINFFKGPYRFAGMIAGDSETAPTDPANIDLPFVVADGSKVFLQVRVSQDDGRLSAVERISGIHDAS